MDAKDIYIIDSNALIAPYKMYYAFDLIPAYWNELEKYFNNGHIVVLDVVKDEIYKGNDALTGWISKLDNLTIIPRVTGETVKYYQEVLEFIKSSGYYKEQALYEWAPSNIADPWLIASAKANNFTLVTQEVKSGGLSKKNPNKKAKIPDVARFFDVNTLNLYDMMRNLNIQIK